MYARPTITLLLIVAAAGQALAHTPSESYSRALWSDGRLELVVTVSAREASRALAGSNEQRFDIALREYLAETVMPVEGACDAVDSQVLSAQPGWFRVRLRWTCATQPQTIRFDAFFDRLAEHQHYASSEGGLDQQILGAENRHIQLPAENYRAAGVESSPSWFLAGLTHVRTGYDHLAFLLALVLIFRRIPALGIAVTGFTAGHAISMGLLAYDIVAIHSVAVESLIGLSICLAAMETFRSRTSTALNVCVLMVLLALVAAAKLFVPVSIGWFGLVGLILILFAWFGLDAASASTLRYAMVVCFGCLHGFGFAAGFVALGVPADTILGAVIRFNLGVEAGQLLFVLVAAWLIRRPLIRRRERLQDAAAAVCLAAGAFWFVARSVA